MWSFYCFLLIWRTITGTKCIQDLLHQCPFPWLLQWYTVSMFMLGLFLLRTFWDVVKFDMIGYSFLTSPEIQENIDSITLTSGLSDEAKRGFHIPEWMRYLAVVVPFLSVAAFLVIAMHLFFYTNAVSKRKRDKKCEAESRDLQRVCEDHINCRVQSAARGQEPQRLGTIVSVDVNQREYSVQFDDEVSTWGGKLVAALSAFRNPIDALQKRKYKKPHWVSPNDLEVSVSNNTWHFEYENDLAVLVILMPAFFVVMGLRAENRILQVMTGDRWAHGQTMFKTWESAELAYTSMYAADLELGAAFQYLTVWAFAVLCGRYLDLSQTTRKVENRLDALIPRVNREDIVKDLDEASGEQHCSLVFAGMQGIWAYILVGIARTAGDILAAIWKANHERELAMKLQNVVLSNMGPVFGFTALLCVYNSTIVLNMSAIKHKNALGSLAAVRFVATRALLLLCEFQPIVLHAKFLRLSDYQVKLANATLLSIWCLLVALFNVASFGYKPQVVDRSVSSDYQRPLLSA